MEKKKIIWILGTVIVVLLIIAAFFFMYKAAYQKGADDQFVVMINGLVRSALDCQPINIQIDQDRAIQLVNVACYN